MWTNPPNFPFRYRKDANFLFYIPFNRKHVFSKSLFFISCHCLSCSNFFVWNHCVSAKQYDMYLVFLSFCFFQILMNFSKILICRGFFSLASVGEKAGNSNCCKIRATPSFSYIIFPLGSCAQNCWLFRSCYPILSLQKSLWNGRLIIIYRIHILQDQSSWFLGVFWSSQAGPLSLKMLICWKIYLNSLLYSLYRKSMMQK